MQRVSMAFLRCEIACPVVTGESDTALRSRRRDLLVGVEADSIPFSREEKSILARAPKTRQRSPTFS